MDPTQENEAQAAAIVEFFRAEFATKIVIDSCPSGGYQIETDAGASFTVEICGATKAAVARAYFEHIRSVNRFVAENRRSGSRLDGGRVFSRAERGRARLTLAKLDVWARQHLPA